MTQYLDWKVGDRVVCVDDSPHYFEADEDGPWQAFPSVLTAGEVYTLAKVGMGRDIETDERTVCVALVEVNPLAENEAFPAFRFRKVQPRKTSIAVFERLLNTQNNEVETA